MIGFLATRDAAASWTLLSRARPHQSVEEHLERFGPFMFPDFEELTLKVARAHE